MAGVAAVAKLGIGSALAQDRPLTPTFYQWIEDLHPGIPQVNAQVPRPQLPDRAGRGLRHRALRRRGARTSESTWDVYVGQTPFVEMSAMIKADVIEPWDNYIPKDVLDDIIPSIREEIHDRRQALWLAVPARCDRHGLALGPDDEGGLPDAAPATWDDYLASAKTVVDSRRGALRRHVRRPWLALAGADDAQHEHQGLHVRRACSTSPATPAVEALKLMKQIMAMANPDILLEGASDAGVNGTPDEVAFAAQRVGYYTKYFNAPLRMAQYWDDPKLLHLGAAAEVRQRRRLDGVLDDRLRAVQVRQEQGEGGRVHQGADLRPADLEGLDRRHARRRIRASCRPTSRSMPTGTRTSRTGCRPSSPWCAASSTRRKAINNHLFGLQQFVIGKPYLGDLPQGRGSRSEGGDAEGRRRGPGRDEARLDASTTRGLGGRRGPRPAAQGRAHDRRSASAPTQSHRDLPSDRSGRQRDRSASRPRRLTLAAAGHQPVAVPAAGARLLRRLSGLPDRPRRLDQLHRLPVPDQRAGQLGRASTTTSTALNDPLMWAEPVAGRPVHDHVPAGNDHPAAAAGDPRRPREQAAARHVLPRRSAHPGRDSEHARLRAVEVDVQLPGRADQPFPGRCTRPVHRLRTRRNGWAARR